MPHGEEPGDSGSREFRSLNLGNFKGCIFRATVIIIRATIEMRKTICFSVIHSGGKCPFAGDEHRSTASIGKRSISKIIYVTAFVLLVLATKGSGKTPEAVSQPVEFFGDEEQGRPESRPGNSALARELGWAYYNDRSYPQAEKWFRQALDWNGADYEAAYGLVLSLTREGQIDRAEEVARGQLDKYAAMRTALGDILTAKAVRAYKQKDYQGGLQLLDQVEACRPLSREERILQGWDHFEIADYKTAGREFEALYSEKPDKFAAEGICASYARLEDWAKIAEIRKASGAHLADLLPDSERRHNRLYADGNGAGLLNDVEENRLSLDAGYRTLNSDRVPNNGFFNEPHLTETSTYQFALQNFYTSVSDGSSNERSGLYARSPHALVRPATVVSSVSASVSGWESAPVFRIALLVSIPEQKLAIVKNGKVYRTYKISTSRYGEGDAIGSRCTPTGHLAVATKIGASVPSGGVFLRRRYTGEVLPVNAPGRDPIVSRIIWLRGLEYTNKNSFHRGIYIHGTPREDSLGRKVSYGCIRMRSRDVIELFNWIAVGTEVAIVDSGIDRASKQLADNGRLIATNATKSTGETGKP